MTLANKLLLATGANPYLEFVSSTDMTITPKHTNPGVTLQYSLNATTWTTIASGATTPSAKVIYFRGSATGTKSLFSGNLTSDNYWSFTGSTNLEANGSINMLIQDILGGNIENIPLADNCYASMFYLSSIIRSPELPSTTLAANCYNSMFRSCASLVKPPALPAKTLAANCYNSMFYACTSLVAAPALPATTLAPYCYNSMFATSGLVAAPALPATTLAERCYHGMFGSCKSLVTASALPATTLAPYCYRSMYSSCSALTTIPKLPATTLPDYCYNYMFSFCTTIKLSTTNVGSYTKTYRVPITGTGAIGSSSLTDMFGNTGGTFTGTAAINTTYYTENTIV